MSLFKSSSWATAAALAVVALSPLPAAAAPVVVNFEGAFTTVGPGQADASYAEQGYQLTPSGGDADIGPSFCGAPDFCAIGNNTDYLNALNDAEVTVTRSDGGIFSLLRFSGSFLPSPALDYSGLDIRLLLTAIDGLGASHRQSVGLLGDGIGNFLFDTYAVANALYGAKSLTFSACFFDGTDCVRGQGLLTNDAQFAIDDLALLQVPEPSAAWLVALSLAGLALTRRRPRG